jgi:DNA ligase (NAD+)
MKRLWEAFSGDMTRCTNEDLIVAVEGFDIKTAHKITNGYAQFAKFFNQIEKYTSIAVYIAPKVGGLTGQVFCFTGMRSKELELAIEAAGGKMGSSVSSKTTYLVTNDPTSTSGKAQKARDIGVKVIGEKELRAML